MGRLVGRQELEKDLGGEDGWEEGESSGVTVFCGTQAVSNG